MNLPNFSSHNSCFIYFETLSLNGYSNRIYNFGGVNHIIIMNYTFLSQVTLLAPKSSFSDVRVASYIIVVFCSVFIMYLYSSFYLQMVS